MAADSPHRSLGPRILTASLKVLLRVVMIIFGSLSAIGTRGGKPALPPESFPPPEEYRP